MDGQKSVGPVEMQAVKLPKNLGSITMVVCNRLFVH